MGWAAIRDAMLLLALAPLAYYLAAIFAARSFFRAPFAGNPDFTPPISILKPIRGLDRQSYENYASFCRQEYPEFEILFCVSEDEPAIPLIQKVIQDFPQTRVRLLIGSSALGMNDKVNKLCRMVREARHDLVMVSDSDVRVEPGFLRGVVAHFADPKVGGVTCLYRGLTDRSFAADIESIGNSTEFVPGVLISRLLGDLDFMLGAVMVTTKKHLAEIGGLKALADYLADDYELGNRIAARGYRIELSNLPVSIVYPHQTLTDALRHQLRWNLTIRHSRPWGHFGLIFSQGLPWALLAVMLAHSAAIAWSYIGAYAVLRVGVALVVGAWGMQDTLVPQRIWMLPLRDTLAFLIWVASFFPQRIHWRGQEFRVRAKRLVSVPVRRS